MDSLQLKIVNDELLHFKATSARYEHPSGIQYTEGVKHLIAVYQCEWLLTDIAAISLSREYEKLPGIVWKLGRVIVIKGENEAVRKDSFFLSAQYEGDTLYEQYCALCTFSGDIVTLVLNGKLLMLPSEASTAS